jgi:transposase
VAEAGERITSIVADTDNDEVAQQVSAEGPREVVTDKGYHSRAVVSQMAEWGVRTYCSEPNRGRQRWPEQEREQQAVYANRRRIRGERGLRLLRQRGEKLERWNQHLYDRGGMRRVHLRGRENILKRLVVHSGAANLGLLMRTLFGKGTPRGLQGCLSKLFSATERWGCVLDHLGLTGQEVRCAVGSKTDDSGRLDRRMKTAGPDYSRPRRQCVVW